MNRIRKTVHQFSVEDASELVQLLSESDAKTQADHGVPSHGIFAAVYDVDEARENEGKVDADESRTPDIIIAVVRTPVSLRHRLNLVSSVLA